MKQMIIFFILFGIFFLLNCQFWQSSFCISFDSLVYQKSELENPELFDYVLVYYDHGLHKIKEIDRKSKMRIDFSEESIIPIVLYPEIKNINLKPAGGIFPFDYNETSGQLKLYWEKGPLVESILFLLDRKVDLDLFNILKLENYLKIKFSENPWAWDSQFFIHSFIKGKFNYFNIKKKESREINIKLPQGQYFSDHPFFDFLVKKEENKRIKLFLGYNCLFNYDLSIKYLIYVNNKDYSLVEMSIN